MRTRGRVRLETSCLPMVERSFDRTIRHESLVGSSVENAWCRLGLPEWTGKDSGGDVIGRRMSTSTVYNGGRVGYMEVTVGPEGRIHVLSCSVPGLPVQGPYTLYSVPRLKLAAPPASSPIVREERGVVSPLRLCVRCAEGPPVSCLGLSSVVSVYQSVQSRP